MRLLIKILLALLLVGSVQAKAAESAAAPSEKNALPSKYSADQIIKFSKKVEKTLAAKGARVGVLARIGRPPSELPEGMQYTHVAFIVYSEITTADGRKLPGYATYNLYQRNDRPEISELTQDFPINFFIGVAELRAGIIIPSAELQRRLLGVLASPTYAALHDPDYSAIANPYTLGKQNCTEFVLDVINAAIYQTDDIKRIKAQEKAFFVAQKVNVNPLKLLFGTMFNKDIATSDQTGPPVTATFETIGAFLAKYDKGSEMFELLPE
jgi:hypothetical protein